MTFKDKVIWITGASSGIGEALTYALHQKGAKLIISSRRTEALETVKAHCNNPTSEIHILPLDLADFESISQTVERALSIYGHIDYLFNNGGISQRSEVLNTEMHVTRKVMEINFFGTISLTREILPSMVQRNSGHIIVTSSVMGKFGTRLRSSYAASKHALHGWFDCLRQEIYNYDIHITLVCPGFVKTNVTLNALEGDGSPHGKMGEGQERGLEPSEFVNKLLPKVMKGKEEVYIGGKEILAIYLKRFFPSLLNRILRKIKVT